MRATSRSRRVSRPALRTRPFAIGLTEGTGLGIQAELDAVYNEATDRHDIVFLHIAVIGFDLTERFGTYVEYVGVIGSGSASPYQASFSGGFTFAVNDNTQFDIGTVIGLTDRAEEFSAFTGLTVRF